MSIHDRIDKLLMGQSIRFPFAGPLRRTVPAIFQTNSQPLSEVSLVECHAGDYSRGQHE
jgi:hypothetical protein